MKHPLGFLAVIAVLFILATAYLTWLDRNPPATRLVCVGHPKFGVCHVEPGRGATTEAGR